MKAYSIASVAVAMIGLQAVAPSDCSGRLARIAALAQASCGIIPVAADIANIAEWGDYIDEARVAKVLCDSWTATFAPKSASGRFGAPRVAVGSVVTIQVRGRSVKVKYVGRA